MKKIVTTTMILAIAVSPLFRGLYFELEANAFLALLALLSVFYLFIKLANREEMRFNRWIIVFGFLLVAAYLLSFIKAVSIRDNITSIIQISEYWLIAIILYDYYHDNKQLFGQTLMLSTVAAGFLNAILGIEALSGAFSWLNNTLVAMRVGGMFQYANTAAIYLVICVVFSTTLICTATNMPLKLLLAGMGNIAFLAMLLTVSRGGFIVGFVVFLILFAIQPRGYRLKCIGSFICIVTPAFMFANRITALSGSKDYISITKWMVESFITAIILRLVFILVSRLLSNLSSKIRSFAIFFGLTGFLASVAFIVINRGITGILPQYIILRFSTLSLHDRNIILRFTYFSDALKLIPPNWLFGVGGGGWYSLYQSVQDSFYVARAVHNHYLQVFLESGILGFLSFLSIIVVSLYNMVYSRFKLNDNTERILQTGLLCGFLALVAHSSFDFNLIYVSLSLMLWAFFAGSAVYLPGNGTENIKSARQTMAVKNNAVKVAIIAACAVLLTFNGLYTASAYYADKGFNSFLRKDYKTAGENYLKASDLDPINPVYHFQLAKVYYNFAKRSTDPKNIIGWKEMARHEAEKSVLLNPYYPEYRELLAFICLESDLPLEALENAKKLISFQPLKNSNYELLAKSYLKSAEYYRSQDNMEKSREMLELCSEIDTLPNVVVNDTLLEYKNRAIELLKEY